MAVDINLTVEGKISALDVKPDTVIVIQIARELSSREVIENVTKAWKGVTGLDNPVFVLSTDFHIRAFDRKPKETTA